MIIYTRNSNPEYWSTYRNDANCGSYALDVKDEWFDFDYEFESGETFDDRASHYIDEGYSDKESADLLAQECIPLILKKCPWVELVEDETAVDDDEILIAFRVGVETDTEYDSQSSDFHFRVRRNGEWYEKNGNGNIHKCWVFDIHNTWIGPDISYNSNIVFFKFKAK